MAEQQLERSMLDGKDRETVLNYLEAAYPQRAPAGPLTIIVSKHDQRVVVLRNGTEIGRSAAIIWSMAASPLACTCVGQPFR